MLLAKSTIHQFCRGGIRVFSDCQGNSVGTFFVAVLCGVGSGPVVTKAGTSCACHHYARASLR